MKTRFRLKHCQKYTMTTLPECKVSQGSLILIGHLLGQVFHPEKIQCHKQHSQKEQVEDIFLKKKKKTLNVKFVALHACNFRRKQHFTPGNFSKFPTRPMPGNSTLFFLDHLWRSSTPGPGTSTYMLFLHSIPLKSMCIQLPCLDFSGLLDSSFRKSQSNEA